MRITSIATCVTFTALLIGAVPATASTDLLEHAATPDFPLVTSGNQILDADGDPVIWQGVNWFGLETSNQAPHGLWARDYRDMLSQIADLGFNTIRVPFSIQAMQGSTTSGIDYSAGRNAELKGLTPIEVMDEVIAEAGRQGLMIILDNHSLANDGYMYDLWFDQGGYTEDDWIDNWRMIATRYRDADHVVAFDLKNEPHGRATWGDGAATDWRLAAERAGNAILEISPDKLIVVEGIEGPVEGGQVLQINWWGGNLEGVLKNPVRLSVPNRLVYSPHEYGPEVFDQPWFSDPNMEQVLAERWQAGFGFIHTENIAPLLIGEFGAKAVDLSTIEGRWITQFAEFLSSNGISWTFWAWNPNSGDTGGVLTDDWTTVHADKMTLLTELIDQQMTRLPDPLPAPSPAPAPPSNDDAADPRQVRVRLLTVSTWDSGSCHVVKVVNRGTEELPTWRATLRLAKGTTVTSAWGATVTTRGRKATLRPESWVRMIPAGERSTDVGLCVDSPRKPSLLRIRT